VSGGKAWTLSLRIVFSEHAWEDYLYWQKTDRKVVRRINALFKDIQRASFEGPGKPEPLKHALSGYWSRRSRTSTASSARSKATRS
jgi:toxin YoeB